MIRVQLDRGAEIGERARPVALAAPEFAPGVEDVGERGIEPQHHVVVADGAVDLVLAVVGAGARDQRLDAVGLQGLLVADQRTANGDDLVGIIGGRRGHARRGIDLQVVADSAPVANAPCGSADPSRKAAAAVRISAAGKNRITLPQRIGPYWRGIPSSDSRADRIRPIQRKIFEPYWTFENSTAMTTMIDDRRVRVALRHPARYFYFYMALACTAVAFLGFAPTYWLPLASGSFSSTPVVHFHGLLFFTWTLYFAFQTWLAASGRIARHRTMGMIGVSLATAMTILGFLVAVNAMKRSAALGTAR